MREIGFCNHGVIRFFKVFRPKDVHHLFYIITIAKIDDAMVARRVKRVSVLRPDPELMKPTSVATDRSGTITKRGQDV